MFDLFNRDRMGHGLVIDAEGDSDPRNVLYDDIAPLGGDIPDSVDVFGYNFRNLTQGATSSCTCQSLMHVIALQNGGLFSPRYAFWKIKTDKAYRSSELPWGAYMIDPIRLAINEGLQPFSVTYDEKDMGSDDAFIQAPTNYEKPTKGGSYVYVTTSGATNQETKWQQVVRYLASERKPLVVGVDWRGSFQAAKKNGGIVPAVEPTGKSVGHAMCAVAYKYIPQKDGSVELYVGFENSYSDAWGDNGRVWLPTRYTRIQSAIAYYPPEAEKVAPPIEKPAKRDIHLEKSKAQALRDAIYEKFPLNVLPSQAKLSEQARGIAGRNWLVLVPAVTYYGWNITDVVNHLYAVTRGKTSTKAYSLDFTKPKA